MIISAAVHARQTQGLLRHCRWTRAVCALSAWTKTTVDPQRRLSRKLSRTKRCSMAWRTASVRLSPVKRASSRALASVSGFLILAACRTFLASAPEVLLAIVTHFRIDFEGSRSTFESAPCQKAVRRAAGRNGVCAATPTEEPSAARRALHPLKPHNASHAPSPTGC